MDTNELGITWATEPVSKRAGPNATDAKIWRTDAQIPVVSDLEKFRAAFTDVPVLASLNGTSFRVMAQDIARSRPANTPVATLRELVINRIRGIRSRGVAATVTVTRYPLPGGSFYIGTDEVEYQQEYTAALVELGTLAAVATQVASAMKLN